MTVDKSAEIKAYSGVLSLQENLPHPLPFEGTKFSANPSFHWFHKIVKGGINYTKTPLLTGEGKHVDIYMVINTTKNKTRTKYYKEVS